MPIVNRFFYLYSGEGDHGLQLALEWGLIRFGGKSVAIMIFLVPKEALKALPNKLDRGDEVSTEWAELVKAYRCASSSHNHNIDIPPDEDPLCYKYHDAKEYSYIQGLACANVDDVIERNVEPRPHGYNPVVQTCIKSKAVSEIFRKEGRLGIVYIMNDE